MAKALVNNLAAEWDPSKYTDEYRDNLMKVIKARIKGEKPRLPAADAPPEGKVVDLMEAAGKKIGAYSKGMRQRVKLAQALVHDLEGQPGGPGEAPPPQPPRPVPAAT